LVKLDPEDLTEHVNHMVKEMLQPEMKKAEMVYVHKPGKPN
jgi:hypothetical protein